MNKLFLAIALTISASFPVFAGMQHDHSSHPGQVSMMHQMDTLETKIGVYDVSLDIMTHKDYQNMMKAMKMEFMKATSGTSHHIAVTIRKDGKKIENATISLKVTGPDAQEEIREMPYNKDMMFQYAGHFNMQRKGKYQLTITLKTGKESQTGLLNYEVK